MIEAAGRRSRPAVRSRAYFLRTSFDCACFMPARQDVGQEPEHGFGHGRGHRVHEAAEHAAGQTGFAGLAPVTPLEACAEMKIVVSSASTPRVRFMMLLLVDEGHESEAGRRTELAPAGDEDRLARSGVFMTRDAVIASAAAGS